MPPAPQSPGPPPIGFLAWSLPPLLISALILLASVAAFLPTLGSALQQPQGPAPAVTVLGAVPIYLTAFALCLNLRGLTAFGPRPRTARLVALAAANAVVLTGLLLFGLFGGIVVGLVTLFFGAPLMIPLCGWLQGAAYHRLLHRLLGVADAPVLRRAHCRGGMFSVVVLALGLAVQTLPSPLPWPFRAVLLAAALLLWPLPHLWTTWRVTRAVPTAPGPRRLALAALPVGLGVIALQALLILALTP
ncbi:MAG TPA: hypothetical protein VEH84_01220 [Alphaproteobacteria bacterium]|nr:hypothetical protein [Alphaproteobacteria bacterium]